MSAFSDALATRAQQEIERRGLVVTVQTNVLPPITLYDARDESASLLELLGIQTYAEARDDSGAVLFSYGTPPRFNPALAMLLGIGLFVGVTIAGGAIVRGLKAL